MPRTSRQHVADSQATQNFSRPRFQVSAERAEAHHRRKCRQVLASGRCAGQLLRGLECAAYCLWGDRCEVWVDDLLQGFEAVRRVSAWSKAAGAWQAFPVYEVKFRLGDKTFKLEQQDTEGQPDAAGTVRIWREYGYRSVRSLCTDRAPELRDLLRELVCDSLKTNGDTRLQVDFGTPKGATLWSLQLASDPLPLVLDVQGNPVETFVGVPWKVGPGLNDMPSQRATSWGTGVELRLTAHVAYRPRGSLPSPTPNP